MAPSHTVLTQLLSRVPRAEYSSSMPRGCHLTVPPVAEDSSRNPPLPLPPLPGIVYFSGTNPERPQHRMTSKSGFTDPQDSTTCHSHSKAQFSGAP